MDAPGLGFAQRAQAAVWPVIPKELITKRLQSISCGDGTAPPSLPGALLLPWSGTDILRPGKPQTILSFPLQSDSRRFDAGSCQAPS